MVNLAEYQQKELRALARDAGMPLRDAMRWALIYTRQKLEDVARVRRKTGLNSMEQHRFFNGKGLN